MDVAMKACGSRASRTREDAMKTTTLAVGLLAATGLCLVSAPSEAGVQIGVGLVIGGPSYRPGHAGTGVDRYGYDRGYREGADSGFKAGRHGKRFEFWRNGDYRDADDGYKRWMGPRWAYEDAFRRGYEAGYRRAYSDGLRERNGRWYDHDRDGWDRDRGNWDRRDWNGGDPRERW
jgi:hypothetical protein